VDAAAGASPTRYPPPTYKGTVEVYRAAPSWASFWLLAIVLVVFPIVAWSRASGFESRRWSESDYGSGSSSSSSDDD
jgi:hypothetical protein